MLAILARHAAFGPRAARLLLLLGLSLSPVTALGDAQRDALARQHFERAETHYRLGSFQEALAEYQAALKLVRRPSIIFNIAQCHRQLGRPRKAIFFYKLYLSDWERQNPGRPPPYQDEVQGHIDKLSARLKESETRPAGTGGATGAKAGASLMLSGLPHGAKVFLDGLLTAQAPLAVAIRAAPGSHQLEVTASGYLPWSRQVTLGAGEELKLVVRLSAKPRSRLWLGLGIAAAVLALVSEGVALGYYVKYNDIETDDPSFDTYRGVNYGCHAGAGVLAAASLTFFVVYALSGGGGASQSRAGMGLVPAPGGAVLAGQVAF